MNQQILVIEDERDIAHLIKLHLQDLGCNVNLSFDGAEGLELAQSGAWNLIVLDLGLPGIDGLEICRRLRGSSHYVPILMLTAKSAEIDRVLGLETGADDYLTKPFSILELVARVKALLRRVDALQQDGTQSSNERLIRRDDLLIEIDRHRVTINGQKIHLTVREFDLLVHFARNPGKVYTRTQLLDRVWGYSHDGYEHTVNSHINRLRAKIEPNPDTPRFIVTVWGVGYQFSEGSVA